jgi:TRAP-type C4-dicarboxylate transport system substrate-binding protein
MQRRILVLLAALAGLIGPAPAEAVTLKLATVAPEGTAWVTEMRRTAAEITRRTDGRVKVKLYPGGVMGSEATVLRKMRIGQLHGGAFTSGGLTGVYREIDVYGLPFLFRSYAEVDYVRSRVDDRLRAGLEDAGLVVLSLSETGFAYFMSTRPVQDLADLRRTKVWALETDRMTRTALEISGVSPVSLPISDVYTGLQTGLLETVAAPPMAAIGLQWHTKVKFLADSPVAYVVGVLALDPRAFSRLSPPDRKVLREVIAETAARLDEQTRAGNREAREALEAQGIQLIPAPSAEERARWESVADQTIERLRDEGVYSAGLIDAIRGYLREARDGAVAYGAP